MTTLNNVISIHGPLNHDTVMKQWSLVKPLLKTAVHVIDFSHVTQCDSASVAFLLEIVRVAKQRHISVSFCQIPHQMLEIAKVNNVLKFLPLSESEN